VRSNSKLLRMLISIKYDCFVQLKDMLGKISVYVILFQVYYSSSFFFFELEHKHTHQVIG